MVSHDNKKKTRLRPSGTKRVQRAGQSGAHPAYGKTPNGPRPFPPEKPEEDYGNRGLHRRAGTYDETHHRLRTGSARGTSKNGARPSSRRGPD